MITILEGKILDVDSQKYEMEQNGKKVSGIAHKVILKEENGTLRKIGIKEEEISMFKSLEGTQQKVECDLFLPMNTKVNLKYRSDELN